MGYVEFSDAGYDYLDEYRYFLFTADKTHDILFEYITKDLSHLPKLFEQYISKRMDTVSFEVLNSCQANWNELDKIKDLLVSAHPFYKHEFKPVAAKAIGIYFNNLLVYQEKFDVEDNWYFEKLKLLIPEDINLNDYIDDAFVAYKKKIDVPVIGNTEAEESLIQMPSNAPTGFANEIITHRMISNMLYFILDISAPGLNQLTIHQRSWIFGNICHEILMVPKRLSFIPNVKFRGGDRSLEVEFARKQYDIFEPLYRLNSENLFHNGIPSNFMSQVSSAIEFSKEQPTKNFYEEYVITDLRQLLYLEVVKMIQSNEIIRKCKNCGKYFVINNRNKSYCDRIDETGEQCSAVGAKRSFQKKLEQDNALKIYNRAYKTHFARVKKGTMDRNDFKSWRTTAKDKLEQVRKGEQDIASFQEWLKK